MDFDATMQKALSLHQSGRSREAEALYRAMLRAAAGYAPAMFYLGLLEAQTARPAGFDRMREALALYPTNARLWLNLAVALRDAGRRAEAEEAAGEAVRRASDLADAHLCLGELLLARGRHDDAERHYRVAVAEEPQSARPHLAFGRALNTMRRPEEGIAHLELAADLAPPSLREDVACELGHALALANRTAEAIAVYDAVPMMPERPFGRAQWRAALCLPMVYRDMAEIAQCRERYAAGLQELEARLAAGGRSDALGGALAALTDVTNFHLPYQGENDRDLQVTFGRIVQQIVGARHPELVEPMPRRRRGRPRVGFVSHFWREHSIAKTHGAWIAGLDRARFETFVVHTGVRDAVTDRISGSSEHFFHRPLIDARLFAFIRSLDLDVLVYPDLGMQPEYQVLAALRLARVQCNGLGHPVTSGLTTIDVALSSALMEPEDAAAHYSERLVTLPNTGFCYRRPPLSDDLGAFDRGTDGPVFICAQNLYKLLPAQDRAFARIAAAVPDAVLWFIQHGAATATADFTRRLSRAMLREGADPARQLRVLPRLGPAEFFAMYRAADIYLDGHHWSGCNTTYEALSVGLPVVAWPGRMMRGRHSMAILRAAGLTETIAADEDSYVGLATRLAREAPWRAALRRRIAAASAATFDDPAPLAALADFIGEAAAVAADRPQQ
jgi:predicted O-linked N-acetylglucosamine transferase (SPINDLY family)